MRPIKFRAKREDGSAWEYGYYVYGVQYPESERSHTIQPNGWKIDPKTVGQFTGLHDKNGKEIYEGDRIKWGFQGDKTGKIEWSNSHFCWEITLDEANLSPDGLKDFWSDRIEIIGNIYEPHRSIQ